MVDSFVLLNDGTSFVLLNDGSKVILNGEPVGGFTLSGTHATQAYFKARPEQLITVEFTFRLISCLITRQGLKICIKAALNVPVKMNVKVKSLLIQTIKESVKLKSGLLQPIKKLNTAWKASTVRTEKYRIGMFSNTSLSKKKKLKELLLRRLKEMMDNE